MGRFEIHRHNLINHFSGFIMREAIHHARGFKAALRPFGGGKHALQNFQRFFAADAHNGNAANALGCGDGGNGIKIFGIMH